MDDILYNRANNFLDVTMTLLFDQMLEYFNLGHFNKAVELAETDLNSPVANSEAAKILAACYFKLGSFDKAHSILCELEEIYKSDPSFLSMYAACCRRLGLVEKSCDSII